jgi:hypothetical protein
VQQKQAKFKRFYDALKDDKALMDFYLICKQIRNPEFKNSDYEVFIKSNKTQYHQQMIQSSISPLWGLIQQYILDAENEEESEERNIIFKKLVDIQKDLNQYCRSHGLSNNEDTNSIKTKLLDFDNKCFKRTRIPSTDGKERRADQFVLNIASLKEYMQRKNLIDTTISEE